MKKSVWAFALSVGIVFIVSGCAVPIAEHQMLQSAYEKLSREYDDLLGKSGELQHRNSLLMMELEKLQNSPPADRVGFGESESIDLGPDLPINRMTGAVYISDSVLFTPGSSVVREEAVPQLKKLADKLNEPKFKGHMVRVNGHSDNQPVVKTKSENKDNWFLSSRRAHAVMEKLVTLGVDQDRFIISGYGPTLPLEPNLAGGKGNPKNRRVEVEVVSGSN